MFCGPVRVPSDAAGGLAKITLSMPDWSDGHVTPAVMDGLVIGEAGDAAGLRAALETDDPVARAEIIEAIKRFGASHRESLEVVLAQAEDPAARVRLAVVRALPAWRAQADVVFPALAARCEDADPGVRSAAVSVLKTLEERAQLELTALK